MGRKAPKQNSMPPLARMNLVPTTSHGTWASVVTPRSLIVQRTLQWLKAVRGLVASEILLRLQVHLRAPLARMNLVPTTSHGTISSVVTPRRLIVQRTLRWLKAVRGLVARVTHCTL